MGSAVAYFTYGTVHGITGSTVTSAGAAAGTSSIAVQFGTTGSIVWSDVLKTSIVAAATAGIVNANLFDGKSLNELAGMTQSASGSEAVRGFSYSGDNLVGIVGRNTVSAGLSAVVQGGSFADGFVRGMIGDFGAQGAKDIGTLWGNGKDPVLQTLAHMGLGGMIAGAQGDDVIAGVIGGGVESVYSNIAGKPLAGSTLGDIAYISGAMFVGGFASQLAGHDPSVAATIAQNAAQNNYLYHHEAQELALAKEQQWLCKDQTCRDQYQGRINELQALDRDRQIVLENACRNPSSGACGNEQRKVKEAANSYIGKSTIGFDPFNVISNSESKARMYADLYGLRVNSPDGYNAGAATLESFTSAAFGTLELGVLIGSAIGGDLHAQGQVAGILKGVGADQMTAGVTTVISGTQQLTVGGTLLQQIGMSPQAAELWYGTVGGLGALGAEAALVRWNMNAVVQSGSKNTTNQGATSNNPIKKSLHVVKI